MEQVAKSINKDTTDIRLMNMYTQGQVISSWNTSCLPKTVETDRADPDIWAVSLLFAILTIIMRFPAMITDDW